MHNKQKWYPVFIQHEQRKYILLHQQPQIIKTTQKTDTLKNNIRNLIW